MSDVRDQWAQGTAYEDFMGRWSRALARRLIAWLGIPKGVHWLDVGCGTAFPVGSFVPQTSIYLGMDISPDTGIMYLISGATSSDTQGNLYIVDKLTGMSTLVGLVGDVGDEVLYRALTVAPEPSSVALLALGGLGLWFARRRQ